MNKINTTDILRDLALSLEMRNISVKEFHISFENNDEVKFDVMGIINKKDNELS